MAKLFDEQNNFQPFRFHGTLSLPSLLEDPILFRKVFDRTTMNIMN